MADTYTIPVMLLRPGCTFRRQSTAGLNYLPPFSRWLLHVVRMGDAFSNVTDVFQHGTGLFSVRWNHRHFFQKFPDRCQQEPP